MQRSVQTPGGSDHDSDDASADSLLLEEIREGTINVKMLRSGRKAVIVRRGTEVRVFGEMCPHMGADMSEARYCVEDRTLSCPWHGYVFSADDGRFVKNPNEEIMRALRTPTKCFQPGKTPRYRLPIFASRVIGARLFIGAEEGGAT
jgi:nitrite reductase/ring-hydroxylating ferredoxin subunit